MKKKLFSAAMALACVSGMAVPAFADTTVNQSDKATNIPVNVTAKATVFDVTLPTALPTSVDETTGETLSAENATITNHSAGSIRVSNIRVTNKKNGIEASSADTGWYLKDFERYDFHNANVDSNGVGISVKPVGGRNEVAAADAVVLNTDASSETDQTLLKYVKNGTDNTASADDWVLDAVDGETGGKDELTVNYDTKVTSVSADITNEQVASIVIVVSWNKG